MYSNKILEEIIINDLSILPGIVNDKKSFDIKIANNLFKVKVKLLNQNINPFEIGKQIISLLRYKLIDKTDQNNFKLEIILDI